MCDLRRHPLLCLERMLYILSCLLDWMDLESHDSCLVVQLQLQGGFQRAQPAHLRRDAHTGFPKFLWRNMARPAKAGMAVTDMQTATSQGG